MRRRITRCCDQANQSIWNQFDLSIMKRLLGISNHFVPLWSIHKLCLVLRVSAVREGTARRRRRWLAARRRKKTTHSNDEKKNSHPPATAFAHMWIQCAFRKWNFSICQFFSSLNTSPFSFIAQHSLQMSLLFQQQSAERARRFLWSDDKVQRVLCVCDDFFSSSEFLCRSCCRSYGKVLNKLHFFHHRAEGAARGIEKERRKKNKWCVLEVCAMCSQLPIDIMYWQKPAKTSPWAGRKQRRTLCATLLCRSYWDLLSLLNISQEFAWISQWKPSVALSSCSLELTGGYHRHTKMQFQWSSWAELLLNSLKRLPIGFLCKTIFAGEHQAHIDFRIEIPSKLCKGREIHFTLEIKHIINILDSSSSGTMKFQYFPRAVRCFFFIFLIYEMMSTHPTCDDSPQNIRIKVWRVEKLNSN